MSFSCIHAEGFEDKSAAFQCVFAFAPGELAAVSTSPRRLGPELGWGA